MFKGFELSPDREAVLKARIRQRVKENLPTDGPPHDITIQEIACTEPGCPTRTTVISIAPEGHQARRVLIHAPLSLVTTKEINYAMERGHTCQGPQPTS